MQAAFAAVDALPVAPFALVGLAGGFTPGKLADVDEAQLDELLSSNFGSALWTAQAAAPRFAARGGGAIVLVGSKTAVAGPAPVVHAASKAAVVRLTQLLADELRADRIRVNAVLPSVIDTPANRTWMSDDLAAPRRGPDRDREGDRLPVRPGRGPDQRRGHPGVRRCLTCSRRSTPRWTGRPSTSRRPWSAPTAPCWPPRATRTGRSGWPR